MDDALERLILVDECDRTLAPAGKLQAHRDGALHRAFSIFLFDRRGRTLLQRRAASKYHSSGKWANSCCGHPRPGEAIEFAASRRMSEELGVSTKLHFGFHARYRADLDNDMVENEFVHVFAGRCDLAPSPNPEEASETRFVDLEDLRTHASETRGAYAAWLTHYLHIHFEDLIRLRVAICQSGPKAPFGAAENQTRLTAATNQEPSHD